MALEKGIERLVQGFIAAGRPSSRRQTIEVLRAGYIASTELAGKTETRVQLETLVLEGLTIRVFSPLNAPEILPAAIYYHGGCFISGGFDTHDNQLRQLAYYGNCRVIAIQYRLAPEHTFPAAHDDAERGANLVWQYADELGVDKNRLTLCGDSAGGHLALVTALRLKVKGLWQPAQLILIYPMLDATVSFESYTLNGMDYVITRDTLLSGYEIYLAGADLQHPEASPLWREDFSGLPAVHIVTAEYDPLCDEGEALFQRLTEQGVKCTAQRWRGVIHGVFQLGGISQSARDIMRDIAWRINHAGRE
ncbi:alpha/beta hydrolase [Enterobacter hormaechei]|uniref:alpha/beta hydrolase n=1 Tax=Enterobacter hormaechei TaxID=158836 RepID=UPI0018EB142C|nr:alpha/beta hydrolase [Enterobacter hormaechei]MBJ6600967.1 alpha/beta hydrolase [Enterobacter hormaechei]MDX7140002.1 alpha/beta hydrolase [Enterobacter hormaechei]HAS1811706.1 alpha/beta hydrolase [Enterobacter hormaechei subsp. xiangfangensis]HBM2824702.1 alpha/beta hydrolase [Enterobacter hormaechei subsp. xiangfangensis]